MQQTNAASHPYAISRLQNLVSANIRLEALIEKEPTTAKRAKHLKQQRKTLWRILEILRTSFDDQNAEA